MAIYLSRKKGGTVATPITPSNASPALMTANVAVNPTGNGYAIENYSNLSPSNSSPVPITSGDIYKAMANGKAISSLSEVAPSNAMPPDMYSGSIYKIKTRNGLLISTANYVSPSDSNPPLLSVDNSWYQLMGASGYLYQSSGLRKFKSGTFTTSTSSYVTVNCGFEPKYIAIEGDGSSSSGKHLMGIYNYDTDSTSSYYANASNYPTKITNGTSSQLQISITSTGFTYRMTASPARTCRYFAIG